jgi:hypothetical protein
LRFPKGTIKLPSVTPGNKIERKRKRRKKKRNEKEKNTYTTAS